MHMKKMNKLFQRVDTDQDGLLTWPEFEEVLKNDWVRSWMAAMELDTSNVKRLWMLLDNGNGKLTAADLVAGVSKLQGSAKSADMNHLSMEVNQLKDVILDMHSKVGATHKYMETSHHQLIGIQSEAKMLLSSERKSNNLLLSSGLQFQKPPDELETTI